MCASLWIWFIIRRKNYAIEEEKIRLVIWHGCKGHKQNLHKVAVTQLITTDNPALKFHNFFLWPLVHVTNILCSIHDSYMSHISTHTCLHIIWTGTKYHSDHLAFFRRAHRRKKARWSEWTNIYINVSRSRSELEITIPLLKIQALSLIFNNKNILLKWINISKILWYPNKE